MPESNRWPVVSGEVARFEQFTYRLKHSLAANYFLANRLGLGEQVEVVGSAGLRVGARHIEAAERMGAHDGSRAFAVDVQVADVELAPGALDLLRRRRVDGSGEPEVRTVGDAQRVVVAARLDDGQDGPEDLL